MKTIKLVSKDQVKKDKNGRNYIPTGFSLPSTVNVPGVGIVHQEVRASKVNLYEENYLGKKDFGYDLNVGDSILGNLETRFVEAYEIPSAEGSRTAVTFTCVVKGDTDSPAWEAVVRSTMKSKGHVVIDAPAKAPAINANEPVVLHN